LIDHSKYAKELFMQGYNCCQAVLAAFCEDLGLDFDLAAKLSSSFGGGMGRLREVCGAVCGMFMVAGMKFGYADPKDNKAKAEHYKLVQELAEQFRQNNGSIVCRELMGLDEGHSSPIHPGADSPIPEKRTPGYYKKRPCAELVADAAKIIEDMIKTKEQL